MKKVSKLLVCLTAVVCAALCLTACGGVKGKYKAELTEGGVTMTATIELKGGDKFTMSTKVKGDVPDEMKDFVTQIETTIEGTYKIDGEKITLTSTVSGQENTVEGTIKDGVITIQGQEYKK